MVSLSHSHIFSNMNKQSSVSSSSSLSTTTKLKSVIQNFVFSHIFRVARAICKGKTLILGMLREKNRKKYRKKILFGSFRLHYNWSSSSHVFPILSPYNSTLETLLNTNYQTTPTTSKTHIYYDSTWNSTFSSDEEDGLSSYLQWLEESNKSGKVVNSNNAEGGKSENEIDKLADMFIANCHEKFKLEKIESYRRFQDMLARSM